MSRTAALICVPLLAALASCSAQNPVSSAVSSAVSSGRASAQQAAEQKAKDLAVQAFRSQVCSRTADGTLSGSDLARLRAGLDAAAAAGLPAQVVDSLRPLLDRGGAATKAQVRRVHEQVCSG
jgi:hypothetical protein